MANEQNYERVRAQMRNFDLRLQRIEQALGVAPAEGLPAGVSPAPLRPRAPRVTPQGRGVPASVTVRRVGAPGAPAAPAEAPATPGVAGAVLSSLGLGELGAAVAVLVQDAVQRAFQPPQNPPGTVTDPAVPPPSDERHAAGLSDELDWLDKEPPEPQTAAAPTG
jgi:hypothetical protein